MGQWLGSGFSGSHVHTVGRGEAEFVTFVHISLRLYCLVSHSMFPRIHHDPDQDNTVTEDPVMKAVS